MTLHEAIDVVLADHATASPRSSSPRRSRRRGLYVKPSDAQPAPARQITARVGNKACRAAGVREVKSHGLPTQTPYLRRQTYKSTGLASTFSG